ncbi:MAG: hypothetical protein WKF75_15755 [Singulisphaera sp.]
MSMTTVLSRSMPSWRLLAAQGDPEALRRCGLPNCWWPAARSTPTWPWASTSCRRRPGGPAATSASSRPIRAELLAWLRHLGNNLVNFARTFRRPPAPGRSEVRWESSGGDGQASRPPASAPPSEHAINTTSLALTEALGRLPDHYRQVIGWRHQEQLPEEIALRLGGSAEAARTLGPGVERLQRGHGRRGPE